MKLIKEKIPKVKLYQSNEKAHNFNPMLSQQWG